MIYGMTVLSIFKDNFNFLQSFVKGDNNRCRNYLNEEESLDYLGLEIIRTFDTELINNQTFIYGVKYNDPSYYETGKTVYVLLTDLGYYKKTCFANHKQYLIYYYWKDLFQVPDLQDKITIEELSGGWQSSKTNQWNKLLRTVIETSTYDKVSLSQSYTEGFATPPPIPTKITTNNLESYSSTSHNNKNNSPMKIDKDKVKYVIGIDLGHGETSAAICEIQWDADASKLENAKDLEMGGNKKVMPSAITILDDGSAYIGDSAFNPAILKSAKVRVCFKKAPKDINGESEQLMTRFMGEVYKRIRENNTGLLTDNNHLVYIATPSGWDSKTQDLYKRMAEKAGIPIGGVTKESRAAFVRAQHDPTSNLGRNIDKGAIVFDMGSSTLDFTYMSQAVGKMIDFGYDCGASIVEKTVYKLESEEGKSSDSLKLFAERYPKLIDYILFEARKVKEQVYFDPTLKVKKTINFEDIVDDDEELEDEKVKFKFDPGELNGLLMRAGYLNQIREAMLEFKENKIPGKPIYGVYMTGGASRMDFLRHMISECWGVPEDKIFRDNDPSLTISQGVAEVARMDMMTEGLDNGLADEINKLTSGSAVYDSFVDEFAPDFSQYIINELGDLLVEFRDSNDDYSLNDLNGGISTVMNRCMEAANNEINDYVVKAFNEHTAEISNKVQAIQQMYTTQGGETNITIPTLDASSLSMSGFNMDSTIEEIAKTLQDNSSGWGAAIAGGAVGLGVAMLLGGPLAWIIGGGALLGKWLFGEEKTEAQKQAEAKAKALPKDARQEIVQKIADEKWDDIQEQIKRDVRRSLQNNSRARNDINTMVRNVMKDYEKSLKSARILVD